MSEYFRTQLKEMYFGDKLQDHAEERELIPQHISPQEYFRYTPKFTPDPDNLFALPIKPNILDAFPVKET